MCVSVCVPSLVVCLSFSAHVCVSLSEYVSLSVCVCVFQCVYVSLYVCVYQCVCFYLSVFMILSQCVLGRKVAPKMFMFESPDPDIMFVYMAKCVDGMHIAS